MVDPILEGETFVAWLLKASNQSREVAQEFLGGAATPDEMLDNLRQVDLTELARDLGCGETEAFSYLAEILRREANRPLPRLSLQHLQRLPQHPVQQHLRSELKLQGSVDALDQLLDVVRIVQSLRQAGSVKASEPTDSAETGLLHVLSDTYRFGMGMAASGWDKCFIRQRWLLPEAIDTLTAYAQAQQWSSSDPTRVLARLIDDAQAEESAPTEGYEFRFDGLAVSYLQGLIHTATADTHSRANTLLAQSATLTGHSGACGLGEVSRRPDCRSAR